MRNTLTVSLPERLSKALIGFAKTNERSRSFVVQKALESYLDEQAEGNIALSRLHNSKDRVISINDMRAKLEL